MFSCVDGNVLVQDCKETRGEWWMGVERGGRGGEVGRDGIVVFFQVAKFDV